jgi:hypothetical protein
LFGSGRQTATAAAGASKMIAATVSYKERVKKFEPARGKRRSRADDGQGDLLESPEPVGVSRQGRESDFDVLLF